MPEDYLFCCSSCQHNHNAIQHLFLGDQEFFLTRQLHGVAKGAFCTRYNGDFMNRVGIFKELSREGVPHFMIGDSFFGISGKNSIFLLLTSDNHFNRFFKIFLSDGVSLESYSSNGGLIDDISKFRATCSGRRLCNGFEVDIGAEFYGLGMKFQDCNSSWKVWTLHDDLAVETARTQESGIQNFWSVGRAEDNDAVGGIKSIHFFQQLIQGLFSFVIPAHHSITSFSHGVDLIDKDDTWRFFIGLFEEVTNLGGTGTDKHLNKF